MKGNKVNVGAESGTIYVTLDTNILPADDILAAAQGLPYEFSVVSVMERETAGTPYQVTLEKLDTIKETAVWDESVWGQCVWGPVVAEDLVLGESRLGEGVLGNERTADVFEMLLTIISNGSFPKPRQRANLTENQRRQLRDAMILSAHIREKREIFVTNDEKAFIKGGRREQIEQMFKVRIMTRQEFSCEIGRSNGALHALQV